MPVDGREAGRDTLMCVWSVTSRCEHPDDFSEGRKVTVWLRKSQRSVMTVGVVRPGSQFTELAVKRAFGRVGPSQDQMGESSGRRWSPGGNSDRSGRR